MADELKGNRKKLVTTEYDWIGGPLDGAKGPASGAHIVRFGDRMTWVGPDPSDPKHKVIAYELGLTGRNTAIYSQLLTNKANEIQLRTRANRPDADSE